jgi:hypothetical protein
MSVLDANFGSVPESYTNAASAWVEQARGSILSDGRQFTSKTTTEASWLSGVSIEDKLLKPGIWSFRKDGASESFKSFDSLESFAKNTPESQAARELYVSMPAEKRAQLDKEMAQYEKESKRRSVMIGINIQMPEPGPAMKQFQKQVDGIVRRANELVDAKMSPFEKELLNSEKEKYQEELDRHKFDANINYRLPEPGKMMQERNRRVRDAITKIAFQSQSLETTGGALCEKTVAGNQTTTNDQRTTSETLPAFKPVSESLWSKLGFTSPDVLAFDQEAPSRAETKLGRFWEDIKDMFGQSDTVNDRLKKAVEGKLTQAERVDLARQEKEFHKKQMESLRGGFGWGAEAPDLADYPLIAKRDQMLRDAEQNICKQVRNSMTATEKKELDDQFLQYAEAMRTYRESPVFKLRPQPGQAIQTFYKSVASAVEDYGRKQAA